MTSIAARFFGGFTNSITGGLVGATVGAFAGFIYAKLADLPAGQAAKAWAVWSAAESAIGSFVEAFFKDQPVAKSLLRATLIAVGGAIGIQELQKRGLIGEKMTLFIIAMRTISVAVVLLGMEPRELIRVG